MDTNGDTVPPGWPIKELPPTSLETPRLTIRAFTNDDCALLFATYAGNSQAMRYMAYPQAKSPEDSREFVEGVVKNFKGERAGHQEFSWLLFRKDTGECIGAVGLGVNDSTTMGGGYILTPSAWGQGFASEAWIAVTDWAKSQPGVLRIVAEHHPDNPASGSVMRKSGMACRGVVADHSVYPNLGPEKQALVVWEWCRS